VEKIKKIKLNYESGNILLFMAKNIRLLFSITLIAAIISIIVSLLITPKFKATAIIYPASANYQSWFGLQDEVDQVMQVLQSATVKEKMIEKFKLYKYYNIDPKDKSPRYKILSALEGNISVSRTRYMSVKIEVLDLNPEKAAEMANYMVVLSDSILNLFQKQKAQKNKILLEDQLKNYTAHLQTIANSLDSIGNSKGIAEISTQAKELTAGYIQAINSGNTANARLFESKLKELGKYSGYFNLQQDLMEKGADYLSLVRRHYYEAQAETSQNNPYFYKFVVDNAIPTDKKTFPNRALIVVFSTLSAFLFTLLLLIFVKKLTKID